MLTNLLNNAVKFTERGEVVLRVLPQKDPWDSHGIGDDKIALRFEAKDTGSVLTRTHADESLKPSVRRINQLHDATAALDLD